MDLVLNIGKGRVAELARRVAGAGNEALIVVPLEATGLVGDATMKDYATLAAVLAGATNEQTTMGRKTLANVAATVDNTADEQRVDADDPAWTSGQMTGNAVGAFLICWVPDDNSPSDATTVPLVKLDRPVTADGNAFQLEFDEDGFYGSGETA